MKIHLAATEGGDINPDQFEKATMAEIGCPKEIVMRHRPTQFGHIFADDGYSAGYYVYIWADTMSADASEPSKKQAASTIKKPATASVRPYLALAIRWHRMWRSKTSGAERWTPTPSCVTVVSQLPDCLKIR